MRDDYAHLSTRPLHILVFLLPLVIAYEIGSYLYLTDPASGVVETIKAHSLLSRFFQAFDVVGFYLPGILLVTVLVIWHVFTRDRWRVRAPVILGMSIESIAWTMPLLVLSVVLQRNLSPAAADGALVALAAPGAGGAAGDAAGGLMALAWQARLTISIGAGLYEELLFRMILIAAIHLVMVDLGGFRDGTGRVIAVILSAAAFAVYHDLRAADGGIDVARFVFFLLAGLYFGGLYAVRGFGIVVAVHAIYDVLVLVLLPGR